MEWHEDPEAQDVVNVTGWKEYQPGKWFIFKRKHQKHWHLHIENKFDIVRVSKPHPSNYGWADYRMIWAEKKTGKGLVPVGPNVARALMALLWPNHVKPNGWEEDQFPDRRES